jgi:endo-1,4-beta-xylanase
MKILSLTAVFLSLQLLAYAEGGGEATTTLKETFKDDFYIGAAIGNAEFEEEQRATLKMVARQFNSTSSANMLKWGPFNPRPGQYNHGIADDFVEFGKRNNMYVVGHVLFWHIQTPAWVFQDEQGRPVKREVLLMRMRERVRYVARRYGSRIDAWDVVNETFMDDGTMRDSLWTRIIGDDFIEQAFRIAAEELPPDVELIYNDYSMTAKGKRSAVVKMISELKQKGVRIDGVGMQGHWSINDPSITEIERSIVAFANAGVDVHITELDIDVLPRKPGMFGADVAMRLEQDPAMDPYRDGLPDDMQQKLAQRYADIFRLFLKHREKIKRVTFWGATDRHSWLNNWPIKGRTNHPLLFDRNGKPKAAFHAVIGVKDITDP